MKRIFKFPIPITDEFTINMPRGAYVLAAQVQRGVGPAIWVMVDGEKDQAPMRFRLAGTGHPIENEHRWRYVATFQDLGVPGRPDFVWHLFVDARGNDRLEGENYGSNPTVAFKEQS